MDPKYEFNAPQYFDFEKPDDSVDCDLWFDQKEGDEGGISMDMVPLFENMGSFDKATSAISGALQLDNATGGGENSKENKIPDEYIPDVELPGSSSMPQNNVNLEQIRSNVEGNITSPKSFSVTIEHEPEVGDTKSDDKSNVDNILTDESISNNTTVYYCASNDTLRADSSNATTEQQADVMDHNVLTDESISNNTTVHYSASNDTLRADSSNATTEQQAVVTDHIRNETDEQELDDVFTSESSNSGRNMNKPTQSNELQASVSNETYVLHASSVSNGPLRSNYSDAATEQQAEVMDHIHDETAHNKPTRCGHSQVNNGNNQTNDKLYARDGPSRSHSSEEEEDKNTMQDKASVKFKPPSEPGVRYKMPTRAAVRHSKNQCRTPKTPTRIQPIRKSTARPLDYSAPKRKYTPRKFVLDEPDKKKARRTEEDRELEKMRKLQEKTKRHRLINERNMTKGLKARNFEPMRSVNVTTTKEFNFAVANRTKEHTMLTRSNTPFEKQLRQESMLNSYKNEPTQPVPFNFVLPDKIKSSELHYVSMAEATKNFLIKRTPSRNAAEARSKAFAKPHITKPITPKLLTRKRIRAPHIESAQEIEDRMVAEMKSYQFKATEVNPKVLEMKGLYGVKPVQPMPVTEQDPFNFRIEQRISDRKPQDTETVSEDTNDEVKKAAAKLKPTIPVPFSFDERDKDRTAKREQKKQQIEEEERKAREFQARQLPSFSPHPLPEVTTKVVTEVVPFKVSERSEVFKQKYEQKLQLEEQEEKKRQFRATKCDVTVRDPFQPIKGLIPPTNFDNVRLHTEERAQKRSEFDEWLNQKEKEKEEAKLRLEKHRQIEEDKEIKKLRKEMVPKANPVRNFKTVEIKKSSAALTEPLTPNLRVKSRANVRK